MLPYEYASLSLGIRAIILWIHRLRFVMMSAPYVIAALYEFKTVEQVQSVRSVLHQCCQSNGLKGTLLVAHEGLNGTVAGSRTGIDQLRKTLSQLNFNNLNYKESFSAHCPFLRLKVKLKQEIVTLGEPKAKPSEIVGTYVEPKDWNALLNDPDVLVIDTRNQYETRIGQFKDAMIPKTQNFRDFPEYVRTQLKSHKKTKIAMYCTGGIRCEKASSFMLNEGFKTVYHLKGGILKYIEDTASKNSLWEGDCFVFDERVAVDQHLKPSAYTQCYGCREPLTPEEASHPVTVQGVCCPYCHQKTSSVQKGRFAERHKQIQLARARGKTHLAHE